MIKNYPQWEIERKKEMAEQRNRKNEQVQPKRNKGSTKAMVAAWGETSDKDSEDEAVDEQALMAIGESDDEQDVSVIYLKDKIQFLSKERLSELLLDFIDESEVINNEKEQLSREYVILKAKCKNLESRASESDSKNAELKNQVLELDTSVLELRFENLKLKLGTGKKKADHTHLTLKVNLGKMKDELCKKGEQIRVLKEELGKGKRVNNIYIVDLSTLLENELTCLSVLDNDPLLWHKKLGHASLNQLNKLVSKDLKTQKQLGNQRASIRRKCICSFDETNILSERQEYADEAIGLVKELSEISAQAKVAPKEGTCDGTGDSIQGNLTGGTEQRGTEINPLNEPVHDPIPQQQNMGETSSRNQLVVKPHKYQSPHPIENVITDPTFGVKTRS
ncbi:uncharacterized protein [Nicotiana sylvestris]|uniref:uncharacterized protein n=1 Tax=Nicotiana sylvestris TaxID=4096 RepID=UPI00388C78C8